MAGQIVTKTYAKSNIDYSVSCTWILFIVVLNNCITGMVDCGVGWIPHFAKVYELLFEGDNANQLSTAPFCYYLSHYDDSIIEHKKEANLSLSEYLEMMQNDSATPINVRFTLELNQLVYVSEKEQTIKLMIQAVKRWYDCRLRWNSSEDTPSTIQMLPRKFQNMEVFQPYLQTLEALSPTFTDDTVTNIAIDYDGELWISYELPIIASCKIDVQMYPFDVQTCSLTFVSTLNNSTVKLIVLEQSNATSLSDFSDEVFSQYVPSDVWALTILPPIKKNRYFSSSSWKNNWYSGMQYRIILRRQPDYQIMNLLIPATMIVIISSCVFLVPPGAGDKMGLSLSILLSLYMFCQLMYDKMPETGTTVPLLSQYFLVCIGLVTTSCLYSPVSSAIAKASQRVPDILRNLVVVLGPYFMFDLIRPKTTHKKRNRHKNGKQLEPIESNASADVECTIVMGSNECEDEALNNRPLAEFTTFRLDKPETLTWAAVGALLDRIFFVVHLLCSLTVLTIYIMNGYVPWAGYSSIRASANLTEMDIIVMCQQLAMQKAKFDDLPCLDEYAKYVDL